ncbi:MAG: Transglutaminase-like superfamily protein [Bradyrhizobium sp.]|jgi:transglutaminase-like putative cysteine protease|nr:Transglutaminase-like superfamily protein [Bradyrhizobium sp.]
MKPNACLPEFLVSTAFVDSTSSEVREFVSRSLDNTPDLSATDKAICLFEAVRDRIKYNPFDIGTVEDEYRASRIAGKPSNYCVPKAILLTAALRAAGIPAAVGFADVRNHLNSPKLADLMRTDVFIYHGYVALWLDGNLFKVTPAFNTELCERFGVRQLIFDGKSDALFHEFDTNSQRHMEYVRDRGWFADPPIGQLLREFRVTYPKLWQSSIHRISVSDPAFSGER